MKKLIVKQNPEAEIPTEVLAQSIIDISKGIIRMRTGRLNDRALFVLLKDATGVSQQNIKLVIDGLQSLQTTYIRNAVKP